MLERCVEQRVRRIVRPRVRVARGGTPLHAVDLEGPTVFMLGAEREGLPDKLLASADVRATIPQDGAADSLNVALAGAIALYERSRRQS